MWVWPVVVMTDRDECRDNRLACPRDSRCQNINSSFICVCRDGYFYQHSTHSCRGPLATFFIIIMTSKVPDLRAEVFMSFAIWRHEALHASYAALSTMTGDGVNKKINSTPQATSGGNGEQGGGARTYYVRPKDSNAAVGVRNRATRKAPEWYDRQTDNRQTNFPRIIVRLSSSFIAWMIAATTLAR